MLTQTIFATLPIATKLVLPVVDPLGLALLRMLGTTAAFAVLQAARGAGLVSNRRDLLALAGLALLGVVLNQVFFLEGVKRTTAMHTNIIIGTIPVFTLGVALLFGRERATAMKLAGIAVAASGAVYLALGNPVREGSSLAGDAMVMINSLFYASYLVMSRDVLKRVDPITLVTYVFAMGCVMVAPLGAPAVAAIAPGAVSVRWVLVLLYIIMFPTFLSYLLSIWALQRVESSLVAMYVYVQPVVTAFLAPLVLGERVTPRALSASAVIFVGLALATWKAKSASVEVVGAGMGGPGLRA